MTLRVDLQGAQELRRRLKAIRLVFKDAGRDWGDETASQMRRRIPVVTGATRDSIRRTNASQRKAVVGGSYIANFIASGSKAHDITPKNFSTLKFEDGGRTVFARKVHKRAIAGRPFKRASANEGLKKVNLFKRFVDLWNKAA